ncbi:MerR family transcriptional regulator [Acidisphaera sp. L21]|uniref:MerR family transcriptional regulator n=1 Tax=Acidisphaera sp. L21 TaxID=1641851 RepID=UPI00131DC137|nr:MerR family transcriptional regulator [Acidisphaera sp. L21]
MRSTADYLNASEAARRLGVSAKALRLYEQRGLVRPVRTEAGWRAYGPGEMARAAEIVALRGLGLSLAQVATVLDGNDQGLEAALAAHQSTLEDRARACAQAVDRVRRLRSDLAQGNTLSIAQLARLIEPPIEPVIAFDLPWPWGGERFELRTIRALNYIIGPLGSGKTRLAQRLAETVPGAGFLGLDRLANRAAANARMNADDAVRARVETALAWLVEDGAIASGALLALLVGLEDGPGILIVDMIEQGLEEATQTAMIAYLRRRGAGARSLFLLTRSSAILDLADVGPDEAIILCPANHSPPSLVAPHPGSPGYEAVATCLAPPGVRLRTEGVIAWRPAIDHSPPSAVNTARSPSR